MTTRRPQKLAITWHAGVLTGSDRARFLGRRGVTLWLTGLSGSGKSTVAREVERLLIRRRVNAVVLDGDNLRFGLNASADLLSKTAGYSVAAARRFGLGFSAEDRMENIRRVAEVAKILSSHNIIVLSAFVSPARADRARARRIFPKGSFYEIHIAAPLAVCEGRDPKGLYKQARAGVVKHFTGVSAPYEAPRRPDLRLHTDRETLVQSAQNVLSFLKKKKVL